MKTKEDILEDIMDIMIKDGPDGHTDGSDVITNYIYHLLYEQKNNINYNLINVGILLFLPLGFIIGWLIGELIL